MALLFMDGFDAGDFATKWEYQVNNNTAVPASSTATRFGLGRSVRTQSGSGGGYSGIKKLLDVSSTTCIVGVAFYTDYMSTNRSIIVLSGDGGGVPHLSLSYNSATGAIDLYRGNYSVLVASSGPGIITVNTWRFIEIMCTIDDAVGQCQVKVSGVTVINYSGDTKNGGTVAGIDAVTLQAGVFGTNGANTYYDDLYVCDNTGSAPYNTFLGDVRVQTLSPSAAGNSTQFTPSTGANYTAVDELPYSATDYVSAIPSGTKDTYQMGDLTTTPNNIYGVQTNIIAKKIDAGSASLRPILRSGGVDYAGASSVLIDNDQTLSEIRTTDPNTSTTWTVAGINNVEAGMEIV